MLADKERERAEPDASKEIKQVKQAKVSIVISNKERAEVEKLGQVGSRALTQSRKVRSQACCASERSNGIDAS